MADIGKIKNQEITEEMKNSYLAYAMSVIVARALPDVRDGLKPVHRRILYAMNEMGLRHNAKLVKSARVVGEVLGKYHPHGDMAVYDSIVRMAQDFSLRYPLIQGQGNWGSVDGDGAAAMRYTEMKMTAIAEEMLRDIEKETVAFADNYDATRQEPLVLPSAIPNLLLNGSEGIAVGMATKIPPHNLTELVSAIVHLIDHPKADIDELFAFVKGPDFPTGGVMFNEKEIRQAYVSGRGAILTRASAEIIDAKHGKQIVISEIPYQVNKSELIEKMADLVKEKKVEGIKDIRDESDKNGVRIAIDLKDSAFPQKILNNLYKHTDLEKYFHMHILALTDGGIQPQTLSLKGALEEYIKHREIVVVKRTQFDLARTRERIHILEGLKKALDHIDAVIQTIKKSADRDAAHANLVKKFKLSDIQATAILEMRLQTLAGLERQKIDDELKEKLALARELESILKDQKKISGVVKKELLEVQQKYGDERRTKIIKHAAAEIAEEDLIPEEEVIVVVTRGGYLKRLKPDTYRVQKRGGKGIIGMETKEEDMVEHFLIANTHDDLLFFTNSGKVFQIKAYEVPEGSRVSKGKAIHNFLSIGTDEFITSVLAASKKSAAAAKKEDGAAGGGQYAYLMMATKYGIMKKVDAASFASVRRSGLIAIKLKKGDLLKWVRSTSGKDEVAVVTRAGQAIRFSEKDIRPMGRNAAGVRAIKLKKKDDEVVGMDIVATADAERMKKAEMLVMMEQGYGKRTLLKEYKRQRRGGSGIKTAKVTPKNGAVVMTKILTGDETEIIAISRKGQVIRTEISAIPQLGRATQGVRIMKLGEGDKLASITTL